ncbi:hypothetical protein HRI_004613100 [Hibiscus trionum]|uniref:Uncharacterized protein n=1 Tax=Hibiscus trionum TaxID=183268 RepID=A0A9W7J9R2_HIBTR|nr:hypothetical protein HRI_004613100 [Hibiscus trionum]
MSQTSSTDDEQLMNLDKLHRDIMTMFTTLSNQVNQAKADMQNLNQTIARLNIGQNQKNSVHERNSDKDEYEEQPPRRANRHRRNANVDLPIPRRGHVNNRRFDNYGPNARKTVFLA